MRIIALLLAVGALCYWLAAGANRGWTKTSVPHKIEDPVTGIEGVRYVKKFVPGVDFLGAAGFAATVLAGASFLFRSKKAGKPGASKV